MFPEQDKECFEQENTINELNLNKTKLLKRHSSSLLKKTISKKSPEKRRSDYKRDYLNLTKIRSIHQILFDSPNTIFDNPAEDCCQTQTGGNGT